jgi:hypothetical protein
MNNAIQELVDQTSGRTRTASGLSNAITQLVNDTAPLSDNAERAAKRSSDVTIGEFEDIRAPFLPSTTADVVPSGEPDQTGVEMVEMPQSLYPRGSGLDLNQRQLEAVFANSAAVRRNLAKIHEAGRTEEFTDYVKSAGSFGFSNVVKPAFDVLTAGNRGSAAMAMELIRGNNAYEALVQGAIDFGDAMPGVDFDSATKDFHNYVDIAIHLNKLSNIRNAQKKTSLAKMKASFDEEAQRVHGIRPDKSRMVGLDIGGRPGVTYFRGILDMPVDESTGLYSAIAVGFMADIFLDPVTYIPAGTIPATFAKIGRTAKILSKVSGFTGTPAQKGIDAAWNNSIDWIAEGLRPLHGLKRQAGRLEREDQVLSALSDDGKEAITTFMDYSTIAENMQLGRYASGDEIAKRLFAHLSEEELALIGMALNHKDDLVRNMVKAAADDGFIDPRRVDLVMEGVESFKKELDHFHTEDVKWEFLDNHAIRDNHAFFVQPVSQSRWGRRTIDKVMDARGVIRMPVENTGRVPAVVGHVKRQAPDNVTVPEELATAEARMLKGIPIELSAKSMFSVRNFTQARDISTKWFMTTVLNDPRISTRVTSEIDEIGKRTLQDKGYDFFDFSVTNAAGKVEKSTYMMPQSIVKTLDDTRKLYLNPEKLGGAMSLATWFTNGWKGYAVLSTGFHARNNWTEISTSFLAGIGRPMTKGKGYTDNLPAFVVRAARSMTKSDDPQMPGMIGIYSAAIKLGLGGSLERVGSKSVERWMRALGITDPQGFDKMAKLPRILGDGGEVMGDADMVKEAAEVGIFFKGWLGAEFSPQDQAKFLKSMHSWKAPKTKPKFDVRPTGLSKNDKTFEYSIKGEPIGSVRIVGGNIMDIRFADDGPAEFFPHMDMVLDATRKGGTHISEGVGGLTGRQLEDLGFESMRSIERELKSGSRTAKHTADSAPGELGELMKKVRRSLPGRGKELFFAPSDAQGNLINMSRDVLQNLKGPSVLQKAEYFMGAGNPVTSANRAMGSMFENVHRMAHYLDRRMRGLNKFEAARDVKLWRFDYGELTKFERKYLTKVWPFYTWWRKNSVLQVWAMMNNPGRYARIPKTMNGIEAMSADWKDIPTPDYFDELNAVRLPIALDDRSVHITQPLGYQDLNGFTLKDIASRMNPVLKIGADMIFGPTGGFDVFLGAPRERFQGESGQVLDSKLAESTARGILPPMDKILRMLDASGKDRADLIARLAAEGLGVGLKFNDIPRVLRAKNIKTSEDIKNYKRMLKDRALNKNRTFWQRIRGVKPDQSPSGISRKSK